VIEDWLSISMTEVWLVLLSSLIIYLAVILVVRLNGLRSFSKMSSFDFAVTVAIGSLLASVAATSTSLANGLIAVAAIILFQRLVAIARRNTGIEKVVDNQPTLLMLGGGDDRGEHANARITPADLRAKLRAANVTDLSQVQAVVMETTGDVSVLSGTSLDPALLEGVIGVERLNAD
jgi:uncharacterized membrane protein YcaP (DUF421 family)